jgi:hypothetical protein
MMSLIARIVPGTKYILYHYNPSKVAAILFIALFGISTILHIFQLSRKRTWYFIPFVIGGICMSLFTHVPNVRTSSDI